MAEESKQEKRFSKHIIGKTVVSKSGKRFGEVGDVVFEASTGELIHIVLRNITPFAEKADLEKSKDGETLIPFSAVMALGDFVVVAEEDIV
jgi:sporulation protein YlmC with PRC-barrel domain